MEDQANNFLGLSEDNSNKMYTIVKGKFDSHFIKVIFKRTKFNLQRQENGESVNSFITTLYELVEHCGYGSLNDKMIRDRLVVGLKESKHSEKLQLNPELTLKKPIAQVHQAKTVKQQQPLLRGEQTISLSLTLQ